MIELERTGKREGEREGSFFYRVWGENMPMRKHLSKELRELREGLLGISVGKYLRRKADRLRHVFRVYSRKRSKEVGRGLS